MQKHVYSVARWTGFITAGLAIAVVFFLLGAFVRLLFGPVSLGPFAGQIDSALNQALPGLSVRYDSAALQWSRDEGRINFVILGARVYDRRGRIIAQAPKAEIDLAAAPVLQGKAVVQRIALVGVQLTLVHAMDGTLRLGVERDTAQSDLLQQLRDALSKNTGPSSLKSFAIRRARLAFYDERTGLFLVAPEASLQIANVGKPGDVAATIDATIDISGRPATLNAKLRLPEDGDTVSGDLSLHGLDISALGRNAKALSVLAPYALSADLTGSFELDHGSTRLAYADFGLAASGKVYGLGHPMLVKLLRLVARYDGRTGRILIDDGALEGSQLRAHAGGQGDLVFDPHGSLKSGTAELELDHIAVNMPGVMQNPVTLSHAALTARFTPEDGKIALTRVAINSGSLAVTMSGSITLYADRTPAIALDGHVAKLAVADLLHYWPLAAVPGPRDWIARNVGGGSLGPVSIHTDIPPGALDAAVLPESAITLAFPIENTSIVYVKGLTPLTQVQGSALLTGDTFKATVASAKIVQPRGSPLTLTGGSVLIPGLHLAGPAGAIKAHIEGALPDVLSLLDQKPLSYPTRFHIGTNDARGHAMIDLDFKVPMKRDLSVNAIGIGASGSVTGLALSVGDKTISNGTAQFHVNNAALGITGNVDFAGANLNVSWDEAFASNLAVTTRITADGVLDDVARERLGFKFADYVKGPIPVKAQLSGRRGAIQLAQIDAQLAPAAVTVDAINFRKAAGVPAQMHLTVRLTGGALSQGDIAVNGSGMSAQGHAVFGPGGTMVRLDMPVVRAGPLNDFALHIADTPQTGLKVNISGRSADGTGLGRLKLADEPGSQSPPNAVPRRFLVEANLERFVLRDGVTLAPFALNASGIGDKPMAIAMSGNLSKTAKLSAGLIITDGERRLRLQADDAGSLMRGLFGFNSLRGGKLELTAALSPPPSKADLAAHRVTDYRGQLRITGFSVVDQPFLARLLSAGSFAGLADLMDGKGIAFDALNVPFHMQGGVLNIEEARASGPSIGATATGYLDRRSDKLALEGALVPIYGINSMLGAIPLLGDVLVSKEGEGVFGISYDVSGNADEPQISVNPLSMLTPGILRRIFEGNPKAPVIAEPKQAPPPPK